LDIEGEVMSAATFSDGLPQLVLGYLNGDIAETKNSNQRQTFMLFGRSLKDILHPLAIQAATLILSGEEKEVEDAIGLVKTHPDILRCRVRAKDRLGRIAEGTPLQIAAMAGDVNLQKNVKEEKDRGIVERLAAIEGGLSADEVAIALAEVITGDEAQRENAKRNQRVLGAIITFGGGVFREVMKYKEDIRDNQNFSAFQKLCEPIINELKETLRPDPREVITSGYIFDLAILHKTAVWFEDVVQSFFGDWWTVPGKVFWNNSFGLLQTQLSARDGHIVRYGTHLVAKGKETTPMRTLFNKDGSSYFNPSSGLGRDFYLADGAPVRYGAVACWYLNAERELGKLVSTKNNSLAKLTRLNYSRLGSCVLM
jgi:hypothetical protein